MLSFNLTVVLTVFVISIVLLISNRVRYDLIGIGSVFVLMAFLKLIRKVITEGHHHQC